jgi:ubiquinone/menaquinone biosynthesis C-methylase UbiE
MRSNVEWKAFGDLDPLWSAASWEERSKRGSNPWTEEEFYHCGQTCWQEYLPHWQKYGVIPRACVEIGCGPGRMTKQLAGFFGHVHAIDVSEGMIATARKNIALDHVTFYLVSGQEIPLSDNSVTAVFSCEVFQHFSMPQEARRYFEEMYRVLNRGGSIMLELPVYLWPAPAQPFAFLFRLIGAVHHARAELRRILIRAKVASPFMHIVRYEVYWLANTLCQIGFEDVELKMFFITGEGRKFLRPWIFARKK